MIAWPAIMFVFQNGLHQLVGVLSWTLQSFMRAEYDSCGFANQELRSGLRFPVTTQRGSVLAVNSGDGGVAEESRPFDFLVNGQLLRGTLQQAVLDAALSAERVLEVEYLLALLPPKSQHQALHPDW